MANAMDHFAAYGEYCVTQYRDARRIEVVDKLAEEVPIALVYNGISHAVMLATPENLEDFVLGFSVTEGIIQQKSELYGIEISQHDKGIEVHAEIATSRFQKLKEHRRNMTGRTGCGLCGTESLEHVFRVPMDATHTLVAQLNVTIDTILNSQHKLREQQPLQQLTGATHACAWMNNHGELLEVREDVGRHNALDKLLGALLYREVKAEDGWILTSSRASYEMVQKTVMAGYAVLAAVSAPTGLAIRMAENYGLVLLGFVRDHQLVVYSHEEKLKQA